jgi:hypothetical protein
MFSGEEPIVQPRYRQARRARRNFGLVIAGIVFGVIVIVGVLLAVNAARSPGEGDATNAAAPKGRIVIGNVRNQSGADEKAFKLILADRGWSADQEMRRRLGAVTAWKRTDKNKEGWLAIAVRDYGTVKPRDAELIRAGIEKLEQYFEGSVELDEKVAAATISGVEAQRLLFKGQLHAVAWWGHMYFLVRDGLGYWLYVAAPTSEEADQLFADDMQGENIGFVFTGDRSGWREQPVKMDSFRGEGKLTLTAPQGIFEKHPSKDQDERGILYLYGRFKKEKDNRKNAEVLALTLDKKGDLKEALKEAKKYLEDRKQEESKDYKLEGAGEGTEASELGAATPVGDRPGRVAEYKLMRGDAPVRYWMVAVAVDADKTYVICCSCGWESRQIWRSDFQELLHSARFDQQ